MTFYKFLRDHLFHIFFFISGVLILDLILWLDPIMTLKKSTLLYLDTLLISFFIIFLVCLYAYHLKWYRMVQLRIDSKNNILNWPFEDTNSKEKHFIKQYSDELLLQHQITVQELINKQQAYKDFIDSWTHDIKVPLGALKLLNEEIELDIPDTKFDQINQQIDAIDHFVEQALYFSRLDSFSNDYLIQEYSLTKIINQVVKQNSLYFIQKNIQFSLIGDDQTVLTDSKWLIFILNQLISNALKYTPNQGQIEIKIQKKLQAITLEIIDSGVGIAPNDLPRIFDKGFTGQNGRKFNQNATGLGLYLAKNLSEKLGHQLTATPNTSQGMTFTLNFPTLTFFNQNDEQIFNPKTKTI